MKSTLIARFAFAPVAGKTGRLTVTGKVCGGVRPSMAALSRLPTLLNTSEADLTAGTSVTAAIFLSI